MAANDDALPGSVGNELDAIAQAGDGAEASANSSAPEDERRIELALRVVAVTEAPDEVERRGLVLRHDRYASSAFLANDPCELDVSASPILQDVRGELGYDEHELLDHLTLEANLGRERSHHRAGGKDRGVARDETRDGLHHCKNIGSRGRKCK